MNRYRLVASFALLMLASNTYTQAATKTTRLVCSISGTQNSDVKGVASVSEFSERITLTIEQVIHDPQAERGTTKNHVKIHSTDAPIGASVHFEDYPNERSRFQSIRDYSSEPVWHFKWDFMNGKEVFAEESLMLDRHSGVIKTTHKSNGLYAVGQGDCRPSNSRLF